MEKQHVGLHKRAAFVYDDRKEEKGTLQKVDLRDNY